MFTLQHRSPDRQKIMVSLFQTRQKNRQNGNDKSTLLKSNNTSDQLFDFFSSICAKHPAYARWEINISHINPKAYHYMFYDTFIARKDDKYNKQTKPTRPTTPTKQSRPTTLQGLNIQSLL